MSHPEAEHSSSFPSMAHFEAQLNQAIDMDDTAHIRRLAAQGYALQVQVPGLSQWADYALAIAQQFERDFPAAIARLERLHDRLDELPPNLAARVLNSLALTYELNEQWDRALAAYHQTIAWCRARQDTLTLGKALYNLAILHYKAEDYETAVANARRAVDLLGRRATDPTWQIHRGNALNELGLALIKLNQLDEAQTVLEQSRAVEQETGRLRGLGISHNNLGWVAFLRNDLATAEHYFQQALEFSFVAGDGFEQAEVMHRLGLLRLRSGQLEEAAALLEDALGLALSHNNHEITTGVYLTRAQLHDQAGQPDGAITELKAAVASVESLRANIEVPETRLRLHGARLAPYEQLVARLATSENCRDWAEAFYYAEMAKSRALVEMLAFQPLRRPDNIPPEWLSRAAGLRQQLQTLYEEPAPDHSYILRLENQLHQLRRQIHSYNAEFESFQTAQPLSPDEVMAYLPPEAVLLEYFTSGDEILAFLVTQKEIAVTRLKLTVSQLNRLFAGQSAQLPQLTRPAQGPLRQPWQLAKLAEAILQPLGEAVWQAPLLIIVPHGRLHYLPFPAMYRAGPTGPHYLCQPEQDSRPVIYAPSATTLLDYCRRKPWSPHQGCLALGYNDATTDLSQAEQEAWRIAGIAGGDSLTGVAAERRGLLNHAAGYRYLHFSCHGQFDPTWPTQSHLRLVDGPLTVTDILHDLRLNADLVSLSACETGHSHILRGDELIGLTRAFLYAGTPSVLVSQWRVDEVATRLFMEAFYRRLAGGSTPMLALTRTWHDLRQLPTGEIRRQMLETASADEVDPQLNYLAVLTGHSLPLKGNEKLLAHPYFWAGFGLVGERLDG